MPKYLITGRQGSGKTTVISELSKRGYTAYNTDDLDNVTKLQNIVTKETIPFPETKVDWSKYSWNWQEEELKKLLESDDLVFIGAVVSNQLDFYHLFDKVFVITVCEKTLRERLGKHQHNSHHQPGEIDRITQNHTIKQQSFIDEGAIPINGELPTEEIVGLLLQSL